MINAHKADAWSASAIATKYAGNADGCHAIEYSDGFRIGRTYGSRQIGDEQVDLIDAMIESADDSVSDERNRLKTKIWLPHCGSCSGMFTAIR
jgi:dihydroxy-acid dehydratase